MHGEGKATFYKRSYLGASKQPVFPAQLRVASRLVWFATQDLVTTAR